MAELVDLIFYLLYIAIFARVILSFVAPMMGGRPNPVLANVIAVVNQITEPILAPLRRVLPSFGMLDLSPMVAIIILVVIRKVLLGQL